MLRYFSVFPKYSRNLIFKGKLNYFCQRKMINLEKIDSNLRPHFIEWTELLEKLKYRINQNNIEDLTKFFEFTNKLNLDETRTLSKEFYQEFVLNKDYMKLLDSIKFAILLAALENIELETQHTFALKEKLIRYQHDKIHHQMGIKLLKGVWKLEDRFEQNDFLEVERYFCNYFKSKLHQLNNDTTIEFIEFYHHFVIDKNGKLKEDLLKLVIDKIKFFIDCEMNLDSSILMKICSFYPKLLTKYRDDELTKNEISNIQKRIRADKFDKLDDIVYVINNIYMFCPDSVEYSIFELNMREIYRYLINFENENLFHLFFVILSHKTNSNQKLLKNLLNDNILLIQTIKIKKMPKEKLYLVNYQEQALKKIQEFSQSFSDLEKDIFFNKFLEILNLGYELCPNSFYKYDANNLVGFYRNMRHIQGN